MRLAEIERTNPRTAMADQETARRETLWQLATLLVTACSYLLFTLLLIPASDYYPLQCAALVPLVGYDLAKVVACLVLISKRCGLNNKELIKDIIESVGMFFYKVFSRNTAIVWNSDQIGNVGHGFNCSNTPPSSDYHRQNRYVHGLVS